MTINNLKELKALIKLCRASGIDAIEVDNIKFQLRDKPEKLKTEQPVASTDETPQYTDQDLMYWSSTGIADNG